jgi:hypothetical protein
VLKTFSSRSALALVGALIATMVAIAPLPLSTELAKATVAPAFDTVGISTSTNGLSIRNLINSAGNPSGGALGGTQPDVTSLTVLADGQRVAVASVQYGPACQAACYIMDLILATKIEHGSVVTVSYTAPASNAATTNAAIQSPTGEDAASFGPLSVTNRVTAPTTPNTPGVPTVVAGEESATITVTAPTGGLTPTSYEVTATPGGAKCTVNGASGSCTITGLTAGTAYTFATIAKVSTGDSSASTASASVTVLAKTKPNTPGVPTVVAGEESATITVTAPTGGLTPTSYEVTASPGDAKCTVTGASGSCTISGLTAGTAYTFTTVAKVSTGNSSASTASASVTVLTKTTTATTVPAPTTTTTIPAGYTPSWDKEPLTDSETDLNTVGFFPAVSPGLIIITDEMGFTLDKKNGIRPKIRMKNYAGKIKMSISATYKVGAKTKKYKCTFAPFGTAKKIKTIKWRWYTPKKACVLPAPLVAAVRANTATLSASGKWTRQWLTTSKKARPDKTKIKPRTLKYTMKAKPAAVK